MSVARTAAEEEEHDDHDEHEGLEQRLIDFIDALLDEVRSCHR